MEAMSAEWNDVWERLEELRAYEDNWDSFGAAAIPSELINCAREFLREVGKLGRLVPSFVSATPTGTISIEWHRAPRYTEVEIVGADELEWVFEDPDGTLEHQTSSARSCSLAPISG